MGVDQAGVAHIPYYDNTALRHAYDGPDAWQHELIDDPQGDGTLHVIYLDEGTFELRYARLAAP